MNNLINHHRATALPGLWHEYANLFPMLDAPAQDALRADIQAHGVREPVIQFEGRILDGRNRYMAARDLGLEFPVAEFEGTQDEALAYVLSTNLHRRHLTESQRAAVAAKMANMKRGGDGSNQHESKPANLPVGPAPISQGQAADIMKVSERSVRDAAKVLEQGAPELVEAVEQGKASVNAAVAVSTLPKDEQAKTVAAGSDAIKAKAKEVRQAKAKPSEPADSETVTAPEVDKARREIARLTPEAVADEIIGLREALAEEKAKNVALTKERDDLKEKLKEATSDDMGRALGNAQRRADAATGRVNELLAANKRLDYRLKKAEARVAELEGTPIDMGAP